MAAYCVGTGRGPVAQEHPAARHHTYTQWRHLRHLLYGVPESSLPGAWLTLVLCLIPPPTPNTHPHLHLLTGSVTQLISTSTYTSSPALTATRQLDGYVRAPAREEGGQDTHTAIQPLQHCTCQHLACPQADVSGAAAPPVHVCETQAAGLWPTYLPSTPGRRARVWPRTAGSLPPSPCNPHSDKCCQRLSRRSRASPPPTAG
jgi:hypothetical protein